MGIIAFDSNPEGAPIDFPRVVVEVIPVSFGKWYWEVHCIYQDDLVWTHYHQFDGAAWMFSRAVKKAIDAGDKAWWQLYSVDKDDN